MEFAHADLHGEQAPCRFVPLNADAITVDSLYRCGTPAETEEVLGRWLRERIRELEEESSEAGKLPWAANS